MSGEGCSGQDIEKIKRPEVARYKPGAFKQQEPEELLPGLREKFDQRAHGGGGGYRDGVGGYRGRGGGYRGDNSHRRPRPDRGGYKNNQNRYDGDDTRSESSYNQNKETKYSDKSFKRRDFRNSSEPKESTFKKGAPPSSSAQTADKAEKVDLKADFNKEEDKKKRPERAHYVPKKTGNEQQEVLPDNLPHVQEHIQQNQQQQHDTGTKSRKKKRNKNNKSKDNQNESHEGETEKKPDTIIKPHHPKEKDIPPKSKQVPHEQGRTLERKKEESKQGEGKHKKFGKDKEFSNHNSERRKDPANNNQRDARDDISFHRPAPPSSGEDSYYRSTGSRGAPAARSSHHRGGGRGSHHNKNRNSMNYDSRDNYSTSNEYSTKSLPWRQGGSSSGRGSRRSSPSSRNSWRDAGSRHSSRQGSRATSPRSSRGNSPFRSRPHSRQSSNGQQRSPVFARRHSPHHGKRRGPDVRQRPPIRPRTPSPVKPKNKRDSRDLDGWTRDEVNRKGDVGVSSYQEAKPPTGRIKSAPPFSNSDGEIKTTDLPPRLEEKPKVALSRKESESFYSDWSQEIEEEEERSLSIEPPPMTRPDLLPSHNRAGVLRLVPEQVSNSSSPSSQGSHGWAVTSNQGLAANSQGWATNSQGLAASSQGWATSEPRPRFSVPGNQMLPGPPQGNDQHRYLFDPNNPSKPIVMEGEPSRRDRPGFAYQSPPGISCRFPVNLPRFSGNSAVMPPSVISAPMLGFNQPPGTPGQPGGAGIQGPDWYDVFNQNIYGTGKMDINVIVRIINADKKLKQIIQDGANVVSSRWEYQVRETRHEIMNAGWLLLKNELYFVCNKDVDGHIWKTVYHEIIELLREAYLNPENSNPELKQNLKTCLMNLFDEGMDYYNQMLKDVSEIYHVNLDRFYDVLEPRDLSKTGKLALIVAQKILIYLGDLSRYREQINGTTNYGRARQYYLKANHLDMRNGRPFNMLAILAKLSNRKFEAVYYNIRCLTSNNPIPASKEGLGVLFYEMKRRWEANEKQKLDKKAEEEKLLEDSYLIKGSRVRREIWIRNEDGKRLHRTTSANANNSESSAHEYDNLSIADLNKRFINTFLHIQGMFFTQINTEDISIASHSLLQQFRTLVNKTPLPISAERLVQIMVLNMYSIEKTKIKSGSESPTYRSVMQTKALELAGDMFAILLERCNIIIAALDPLELLDDSRAIRQEDLAPLFAAIKVWCDWLMGNNDSWCPVVSAEPFTQLAQLATRLEPLKYRVSQILSHCLSDEAWTALPQSRRADYEIIRLTEDSILCEYEFWFRGLEWSTYRQFCPKSCDLPSAEFAKRVDQIRMCVEFMEGLDPPVLKWSAPDNSHVCLVTDRDESTQASVARDMAEANLTALIARDEDILEESYSEGEDDVGSSKDKELEQVTDEVARLRLRKVELERLQTKEARRAQREILDQHVRTTLEIRPKFVLPDTNEFIDNLESVKELARSGDIQIRVSVVVLGELEGLTKSREMVDRPEHAAMLRENSKAALTWIREKPANVKCVTTKGNILTSLIVTAEQDTGADQTNDERILQCCLNLDTSPAASTKDGMKTVFRNSVLLTDDRNLKLKAHIEDCAVSRIKHFLHWFSNKS